MRPITYKGFKIQEGTDITTGNQVFKVYTKEEWAYGEGFRSYEWEACTMQEAKEFIDSY
ncbi:hypothetical protein [Brevibacillus brevis]|uniref:hypothetical protein n=1 Tax=Brevibacillus brevis TaxID=1393 RepID=UPI00165DC32B|nr:hypothetical protein [Brevibacillus brevis]